MYKYNIIYYTYIIYISYLFIYNLFIDITAIDDLQAAPAESTMQPPCCAAVQLCSSGPGSCFLHTKTSEAHAPGARSPSDSFS